MMVTKRMTKAVRVMEDRGVIAKRVRLHAKAEWSELLHVALRKVCDSKATSAAWNLIYLMDEGWEGYLVHLKESLPEAVAQAAGSVSQGLRCASMSWKYLGSHETVAFYCVLCLVDDTDWEGFASFLARE